MIASSKDILGEEKGNSNNSINTVERYFKSLKSFQK